MKKITDKSIEKFKEYLTDEEKSKATVEKYVHDLTSFSAWLGSAEFGKAKVLEYKEYIKKKLYLTFIIESIFSNVLTSNGHQKKACHRVETL